MVFNNSADFEYCIWLLPKLGHEWYDYTNGCAPHITLDKYIKKENLANYKKLMSENINVTINLVGKLYQTETDNFYALQYDIELENKNSLEPIPYWWPDDAHISFRYKYNFPFSEKEIIEIEDKIKLKMAEFNVLQCRFCNGDFSTWKQITI